MRKPMIAGNWKMYQTPSQSREFLHSLLARLIPFTHCDIVVAPPFVSLTEVRDLLRSSPIRVAAQNCHWESEGAFTGEVSAEMLIDAGCEFVIIGHSERRRLFGENDDSVNRKMRHCLETRLQPIFCLGETLSERESGDWQAVIRNQFEKGLASLTAPQVSRIIIAYEPVWAIGTGKSATPELAQEVHGFIRRRLVWNYDAALAEKVRILYGGSVKPGNIGKLIECPDIDGALVGGASLNVDSFTAIVSNSGLARE